NDPEDLGLAPDGALWIGDIGDGVGTDNQRVRVAFERLVPGSSNEAVPYRALYPPSGKFHAEAMVLDNSDQPLVIAQQSGKGVLYRPDRPLVANTETGLLTLVRVGEFVPSHTGTANPLGSAGEVLVSGAARSPDGSKVV